MRPLKRPVSVLPQHPHAKAVIHADCRSWGLNPSRATKRRREQRVAARLCAAGVFIKHYREIRIHRTIGVPELDTQLPITDCFMLIVHTNTNAHCVLAIDTLVWVSTAFN